MVTWTGSPGAASEVNIRLGANVETGDPGGVDVNAQLDAGLAVALCTRSVTLVLNGQSVYFAASRSPPISAVLNQNLPQGSDRLRRRISLKPSQGWLSRYNLPTRMESDMKTLHLLALILFVSLILIVLTSAANAAISAPTIGNVTVTTPDVARYDKFEVRFDVTTVAANPYLPFDAAPPPGVQPGQGVSVDALFSPDNWTTVITQPAFLYQPYTDTLQDGQDHLTPSGPPRWTVRFAPQQAGAWQYRLRAQDAGGVTLYPIQRRVDV